jgi:hypothetical protein
MSADTFREVSNQSWFGRIGNAFKGIVFGLILFVVAFPLLFWNEGRAVKRQKTLEEGAKSVISISADAVDNANDQKLVHLSGEAKTDEVLTDSIFGVSVNAIKLHRGVEMYQWKENKQSKTKKKIGGGTETVTEYTYQKDWSDRLIDSSDFKITEDHSNPASMPYDSETMQAQNVAVGAFQLSSSLIGGINNYTDMALPEDLNVPEGLRDTAIKTNNGFYIGWDPAEPEIGDVRVRFKVAPETEVSIISKQTGNTFEPYLTKVGGTIELLEIGTHSADAMIETAQQQNKIFTWILRAIGFLMMWFGLMMILKPLSVIADVLPILGSIVGAGAGIIAFLIAAICWMVTVAIAWIFYRPLLGIALLVIAAALLFALRGKLKKAEPVTAPAAV